MPGQALRPLVVTDVRVADPLENGLPGLAVDVLLNEKQFAGGMPLEVVLYAHCNSEPSKLWRAFCVDVDEIGSSGASVPTLAEGTVRQNTDPTKVILTGMVDGPTYKATVCLVPTDVDYEADAKRLLEIKTGKDKDADLLKKRDDIIDKWREYADHAQSQISGEGGIPIDFSSR